MRRGGTVCGAVSLTVIFCVLCMAVFAALTFVTANRERSLAELDAQRAGEFYRADSQAVRIAAALRNGDRDLMTLQGSSIGAMDTDSTTDTDSGMTDGGRFPGTSALPDVRFTDTGAGTVAEYSLPAGGEQQLDVQLLIPDATGRDIQILKWKRTYADEWETDNIIILAEIE